MIIYILLQYLYAMEGKDNLQPMTAEQFNISVQDMCANMHYFIAFPYYHLEIGSKSTNDCSGYMLTYSNQLTQIKDLVDQFKQQCFKLNNKAFQFQLSNRFRIDSEWTIKRLKRYLKKDYIDGLVFFTKIKVIKSFDQQCCITSYLDPSNSITNSQQIKIYFSLPSRTQSIISVVINEKEQVQDAIKIFLSQAKQQLGVDIDETAITQYRINGRQDNVLDRSSIIGRNDIDHEDMIEVIFKHQIWFGLGDDKIKKKELVIIYKGQQGKEQRKKFSFQFVKNMQLEHICRKYFNFKQEAFKKENSICLKIMELIIKPNQTLWKAYKFFQEGKANEYIIIVGHIVNQRKVLNNFLNNLSKCNDKPIQQQIWKSLQYKQKLHKKLAQLTKDKFIKDIVSLSPIFIYTCQSKNTEQSVYLKTNKCLREKSILNCKVEELSSNQYFKFASALFNSLKKIDPDNKKSRQVYRGVTYKADFKEGEIVIFKNFLSTSTNKQVALDFINLNQKPKQAKMKLITRKSLFIMNIINGKSIQNYSVFKSEKEVLLLPFTQFKINKLSKKELYDEYYMQQIGNRDEIFKDMRGNFLLWIDDSPFQGKSISQKIQIEQPLIYKYFPSTHQFKVWLQQNKNIILDLTANILVISDMKRVENGVQNPTAGIESLKILQQYGKVRENACKNVFGDDSKIIPVVFYVGNVEATFAHLKDNDLIHKDVNVCNRPQQLKTYIIKHLNTARFEGKKSNNYLYGGQIKQKSFCEIQ